MNRRRVVQIGMLVWALVGAVIALSAVGNVNPDARVSVGVVSVVGPLAAVAASRMIALEADRPAGALLLVSVLTPTYFAYLLNLPALLVGVVLLAAPRVVLPRGRARALPPQHV